MTETRLIDDDQWQVFPRSPTTGYMDSDASFTSILER